MADWFKLHAHFFDGPKIRYCMSKEALALPVLIWTFAQCCRERADRFAWGNSTAEIGGLGLVLNIPAPRILKVLQLLVVAGLIRFEDNCLVVADWENHQSDYLSRKGYFADRYEKEKHGEAQNPTVKIVNNGVPPTEESRGDEKRVEESTPPEPGAGVPAIQPPAPGPLVPPLVPPPAPQAPPPESPAVQRGRKPKDLAECLAKAQFIGMLEQDARDWYRDCEACDWRRGDGTVFDAWVRQMTIKRDQLAERRAQNRGGGGADGGPLSGAQLILKQNELKRVEERIEKLRGSVDGHRDLSEKDREDLRRFKLRQRELITLLGMTV